MTIRAFFLAGACLSTALIAHLASAETTGNQSTAPEMINGAAGEIVVTAQKRSERLIDIPISVTALSGAELENKNIASLSDLQQYAPGLSVIDKGAPGMRQLVIRGINSAYTSGGSPLVATYVDDFVVGAANPSARGGQFGLDLLPYDINGVEVLKGPQGTLYGADAMGGIIKYSLREPDLGQFEARVGGGLVSVDHAKSMGQQLRGALSVPIVRDRLALRVSAYEKYNPGFSDNVVLGVRDANHSKQRGGTAQLLWQATDDLKIRALAVYQAVDAAQSSEVSLDGITLKPIYGNYKFGTNFAEPFRQRTFVGGVSADWALGFATLTDATGYSRLKSRQTQDLSSYGVYCRPGAVTAAGCVNYPFGDALTAFVYGADTKKFNEELRLASPARNRLQWMVGGTYTWESTWLDQSFPVYTPARVLTGDNLLLSHVRANYQDYGIFGNVSFKLTPKLEVGAGVRYARYYQSTLNVQRFGILGAGPAPLQVRPWQGVTTWSADARYHFNPDAMVYIRAATAFRPGGGCATCGNVALQLPGQFNPDRTTNYEAGLKGRFFDRRLQLTADVFWIDWTNIQLTQRNSLGLNFLGNGGKARSKGFDMSASLKVATGLTVSGNVAYTDAYLTEDVLVAGGAKGDRLPGTPPWAGFVGADYVHPIAGANSLLGGASLTFRSSVNQQLAHSGYPGTLYPWKIDSQQLANLYVGAKLGHATVRATLSNVFNQVSYAGVQYANRIATPLFIPVRPRALDLSVDFAF
jgi:iron complex outermembrane receptor protein